jgi:hypothetical protein
MRDPTQHDSDTGYDSPLLRREQDDYNRWPIATGISNIIGSAPLLAATRIGLDGRWGEGKTTILNFLQTQQLSRGNVVVRFSPWGVHTEADLWREFSKTLRAALAQQGFPLTPSRRLWMWLKERAGSIKSIADSTFQGAKLGAKIAIPGAGAASAEGIRSLLISLASSPVVRRFFSITAVDIERLSSSLGDRRVVVLIDDLDRTDPSLIPTLLLNLRELLDFPRFVFVLAFDRHIVAKALHFYNAAWGDSGEKFLEKIIDFPIALPSPTTSQILALAQHQFASLAPFVSREVIEDIAPLLPSNPRRVKLFVRLISGVFKEAMRHDPEELDWPSILVFFLIRIESEPFALWLIDQIDDEGSDEGLAWLHGFSDDNEDKQRFRDRLGRAFKDLSPEVCERLMNLIDAWRSRRPMLVGELLAYQLTFFTQPHAITWGEFKSFFREWLAGRGISLAWNFIVRSASQRDLPRTMVAREFFETVIMYYGVLLERAANTEPAVEHRQIIEDASALLDLLRTVYFKGLGYFGPDQFQTSKAWASILKTCLSWIHFRTNPGEPELRAREASFLEDACKGTSRPEAMLEVLRPWQSERTGLDPRTEDLRDSRIQSLAQILYPLAIANALSRFSTEGGISQLLSENEHPVHAFLLSSPQSPVFSGENRLALMVQIDRQIPHQSCAVTVAAIFDSCSFRLRAMTDFAAVGSANSSFAQMPTLSLSSGRLWCWLPRSIATSSQSGNAGPCY